MVKAGVSLLKTLSEILMKYSYKNVILVKVHQTAGLRVDSFSTYQNYIV